MGEKKEEFNVEQVYEMLGAMLPEAEEESAEDIANVFSALLATPDKEFEVLAPIFLDEISKTYGDTGMQLAMANTMNTQGLKYEDMVEAYISIAEGLDTEISDEELSPIKKNFLKDVLGTIVSAIGETEAITKRVITIPFFKEENATEPKYAHIGDAGADLYALEDYTFTPGEQHLVRTGISCAIPRGYAMLVQPRSGLSSKTKLRIANCVGLIDSSYRGEIMIPMENIEPKIKDLIIDEDGKATGVLYGKAYKIEAGDRIAQARLVEVPIMEFQETSKELLGETDRGDEGFGSSGK